MGLPPAGVESMSKAEDAQKLMQKIGIDASKYLADSIDSKVMQAIGTGQVPLHAANQFRDQLRMIQEQEMMRQFAAAAVQSPSMTMPSGSNSRSRYSNMHAPRPSDVLRVHLEGLVEAQAENERAISKVRDQLKQLEHVREDLSLQIQNFERAIKFFPITPEDDKQERKPVNRGEPDWDKIPF